MVLTSATLVLWLATMAQAAPLGGDTLTAGWSVSAGAESQSLRDVSRGGPPVDASPIDWQGSGPSISFGYERPGTRRSHRATVDVSAARSFSYNGPVQRIAAPREDSLLRVEARYEYRRYPLDDLFMRGFDAGVGVQGIGRRVTYTRRASAFAVQHNSELTAGIAWVAAARIHRWARWSADVEWTNGISAARARETVDVDALADARRWGGGWLTDLAARLTIRLTGPAALSVTYLRTGEGTMVTNNAYTTARERIAVGVTYAR
jgi:hypothetical protein